MLCPWSSGAFLPSGVPNAYWGAPDVVISRPPTIRRAGVLDLGWAVSPRNCDRDTGAHPMVCGQVSA